MPYLDHALQGYKPYAVNLFETASGFTGIVTTSNSSTGVAKANVTFASGTYDVAVNYWDLIGGRAEYQLELGDGTVGTWEGDMEDKLGHAPSIYLHGHSARRRTFRGIQVWQRGEVRATDQADGIEPAPIDYPSFLPPGTFD